MAKLVLLGNQNLVLNLLEIADDEQNPDQFFESFNSAFGNIAASYVVVPSDTIKVGVDQEYVDGKFRSQKPFPSWSWDESYGWVAPVPHPSELNSDDTKQYVWEEKSGSWIEP